jgi:hypothetical protein
MAVAVKVKAATPAVASVDDGSARALHQRAVARHAALVERVGAAAADVQQAAGQIGDLDAQAQAADAAMSQAKAALDGARRQLVDRQASSLLAQGEPTEAEAVAATQEAQAVYDGALRVLTDLQAKAAALRAELAPARAAAQQQHADAQVAHSDLEQLAQALSQHVAQAHDRAGAEAAAEILQERSAIRERIREARAALDVAYADMAALSESVEERMADYRDHRADVRGVDMRSPEGRPTVGHQVGPMTPVLEPQREVTEQWQAYLESLQRNQGKVNDAYLANVMTDIPRAVLHNCLFAAVPGNPNTLLGWRKTAADILVRLAKQTGEE